MDSRFIPQPGLILQHNHEGTFIVELVHPEANGQLWVTKGRLVVSGLYTKHIGEFRITLRELDNLYHRANLEEINLTQHHMNTIDKWVEEICDKLNIQRDDLLLKSRKSHIVQARQKATWILYHIGFNHAQIAMFLNQDRTTVYSSIEVAEHNDFNEINHIYQSIIQNHGELESA